MLKKILCLIFFAATISAQQKLPDFKFQKIKNNFYLLEVFIDGNKIGANMGIYIGQKELLVIDTHFNGLYPWLRNSFKKITDKKIKYIINTHWHPDHNLGNGFQKKEGVIIAHKNVFKRLATNQTGVGLGKPGQVSEFPPRPQKDLPDILFDDNVEILMDSSVIKVQHYPNAHTDGDCVVIFDELKIVYLSDLYWSDEYPFVDVYTGGNVLGLRDALTKIIDSTDKNYIFISGHGGTGTRKNLKEYVNMIDESIETVSMQEKIFKDGKNFSEVNMGELTNWKSDLVPDSVWVEMIVKSL